MFFIQPPAKSVNTALESWSWLPLKDKKPFAVTALGDVFLEATDGVWFLDRIEGKLTFVAKDQGQFQQVLDTDEGQEHYLWYSLIETAKSSGIVPEDHQCYDFKIAPIRGGNVIANNLKIRDFALVLKIAGLVHEQIKDLPEGTAMQQVKISG